MTLTEGILIVTVIILTVTILTRQRNNTSERSWSCVDNKTGDVTSVEMKYGHSSGCKCPKCSNPEHGAHQEHVEYFSNCNTQSSPGEAVDYQYADGTNYADYVTSLAVDNQVLTNHGEFVKDRLSKGTWTGKTYSPDSHDSYDPQPWIGLRRPQQVPVCDPTQVPDMDTSLFLAKPKFTWSST